MNSTFYMDEYEAIYPPQKWIKFCISKDEYEITYFC